MSSKYDAGSSKYIEEMLNIPAGAGCELKLEPITVSMSDSATTLVKKWLRITLGLLSSLIRAGRSE